MTWSERLKSTFNLFKNIALPLYLWYLIYLVLFGIIMILFSRLPPVESFMQSLEYLDYNNLYLGDDLLKSLPLFAILFAFLSIIGLLITSLLYTGIYHLTVKGFKGQAAFRDFNLTDAKRMISWNSLVLLLFLGGISVGILLFAFLGVFSDNVSYAFAIIFPIFILLFSIFLIPWVLSGGYYILAYRELPFGKACAHSWRFFRQNMGTLWGAVLTMFFINIFIVLIQEASSTIGSLISFIATPFFSLIPIVWTLTLISEQERLTLLDTVRETSYSTSKNNSINNAPSYDDTSSNDDSSSKDDTYSSHENFYNDGDSSYNDSPYHTPSFPNDIETNNSLPHYKPRKEDSPPGYYHSSDRSEKIFDAELNFCPTCGTKVRSNAVYCSKCAIKLR